MEKNPLKMGYLMVSRALLMEISEKQVVAHNDEDAFLRVLTRVNYREATVYHNGKQLNCARGESIISFKGWADILGWSRGRTRGFFERCFAEGSIEKVPDECQSHIRIVNFDGWTGNPTGKKSGEKPVDEALKVFMDKYRDVTRMPIVNKGQIAKEWKKLSARERELAQEHIEDYYYGLTDVRYCLRAARYLEHKAFENDFSN